MKIFITGDSTASIKESIKRPEAGWGEKLNQYLTENVKIINAAQNGRSTKSFLSEKRLEELLPQFSQGDYLFIQFGHNDGKVLDETRFTEPYGEYQENLKIFITEAKKKGVTPVLLTSVSRRRYLEDGTLDPKAIEEYPFAMLDLGHKEEVTTLDIYQESQKLYNYLGVELSKKLFLQIEKEKHPNYPEGVIDNTHFCELGAKMIANLIACKILESNLPLKEEVNKNKLMDFKQIKKELEHKNLYE